MAKSVTDAKEFRQVFLLEFEAAVEDLQEMIDAGNGTNRNLRNKLKAVKEAYDEVMRAHAKLVTLEKTPSDETKKEWIRTNLWKPYKEVVRQAEDVIYKDVTQEDEEEAEASEKKAGLIVELTSMEAVIKAEIEGLQAAVGATNIWLRDNHKALMDKANKLMEEIKNEYLNLGKECMGQFKDTGKDDEVKRQQTFREGQVTKLAAVKATLLSKTPAQVHAQPGVVQGGHGGDAVVPKSEVVEGSHHRTKSKMKMAAMPVPKFSGKIIDYPEWKMLFKDCVEPQYEDSAAVMILKTQALPEELRHYVPRSADLAQAWEKLDKQYLDPHKVWKGVKKDLQGLNRKKLGDTKYVVSLVDKLLDAESLLDTVGMAHWLRQEDKIPEYEDFLTKNELLEWVRTKPKMSGTRWENFKEFLIKLRDEYEEMTKAGTGDVEDISDTKGCDTCKSGGRNWKTHTDSDCKFQSKGTRKKTCWKCGSEDHLSPQCTGRADSDPAKKNKNRQEAHSNFLRTKDCKWCGKSYQNEFTCSGCGVKLPAKTPVSHCLAHCAKYSAASAKERGDMVVKGKNCVTCLHHEHGADQCYGKDKQHTICGLDNCSKRHHPTLHSATQPSIQAVQAAGHVVQGHHGGSVDPGVEDVKADDIDPGVGGQHGGQPPGHPGEHGALLGDSVQGKFISRIRGGRQLSHKITWNEESWSGGTAALVDEQRKKEVAEMKELLAVPIHDGGNVLLLIQKVKVKYGPSGNITKLVTFWDDGSTCSLVRHETAEQLGCPHEPVTITIETVNGELKRDTKIYCLELITCGEKRVLIKAFGVDDISEVKSVVDVSGVKHLFSEEVKAQWGKVSKRPVGKVDLLVGQEYAGFHPVQVEAKDNLVVCRTMFGQGWVLTGTHQSLQTEDCSWGAEVAAMRAGRVSVSIHSANRIGISICRDKLSYNDKVTFNQAKLTFTQDREYYTTENLGIEPARRCPGCRGCKECSWRGQQLSRQEAFEYELMEKNVEFKDGKFHVKYPFLVDPKELSDNYNQVRRIAESEERKLEKEGREDEFNQLFQKLQDLKAIEEISESEIQAWTGPTHYVSLQHVVNEESATTSFRIVTNSSLKTPGNPHSLNSITAKGPNMLVDPYKILIRYRHYLKSLNSDITKAYYQLHTGLLEKHVRRVLWRNCDKSAKWKIYGYIVVAFGDIPAAVFLEICFRMTITMFGHVDLMAAFRLHEDHYVDDITTGGTEAEVTRFKGTEDPETLICDGTMPQIMMGANLVLKAIAVAGDPDDAAMKKLSGTVLGLKYSTERDMLTVRFRVNVTMRKRGEPTGPDIKKGEIQKLKTAVLTRRILLGVCNSQFDMLGLVSPLLIKMKVGMRDMYIKELAMDWDTRLEGKMRETWVEYLEELIVTEGIEFQRCVRPDGEVKEFWIIVFFDGSDLAYAAVLYCRWEMVDGEVVVKLLCSKARVAPLQRLSTPRVELNGAVIGVRLLWTVVQALEKEELPTKALIGGDAETVLAAREKAGGALGEYFGNRVGEIWDLEERISQLVPIGMTGNGDWYHMPSKQNAADRPSRIDSKPEDLLPGSDWQDGLPYLKQPFQEWPWERNFAMRKMTEVVPKEELTSKYRGLTGATKELTKKGEDDIILRTLEDGYITNDYDELVDRTEPWFRRLARIRAEKKPGFLTLTSRELAVRYWYKVSMGATRQAQAAGRLKELTLEEYDGMLVLRGRATSGLLKLLGAAYLPVLMSSERIAELIMIKSHVESDHKSVDVTLFTSRQYCWIVNGRKLAKTMVKLCIRCRFLRMRLEKQKMASLPPELCIPCPAFTNIGVDLAGPFLVKSMVKKRDTRASLGKMKVWAVLFLCLNTRAIKIYLAPGYATSDFLLAWKEFTADCGVPRRVHSDRGTQLISAAGEVEGPEYDWDEICAKAGGRTEWKFTPSGAQFRNGSVEAFVKQFKWSLAVYKESGMNYAELQSVFKRIASVLNSRPISARYGPKHAESDPDYLEVITPNMLLTARSGVDLPIREYSDEDKPSKRLAYKEDLENSWWNQWKVHCFDSLLPTQSWHQKKRGVKPGDIVLVSYTDKSKTGTFRLGRVDKIEVDEDGLVRTCVVQYRLVRSDLPKEDMMIYFKGLKCKSIRVPVQRLVMILPIEEQLVEVKTEDTKVENQEEINDDNLDEVVVDEEDLTGEKEQVEEIVGEKIDEKSYLIQSYRMSLLKKKKVMKTTKTIKSLMRSYAMYLKEVEEI